MTTTNTRTPVLTVEGLQVAIPTPRGTVKAVRDLSFAIYPGETFALVGESGSGKSMTCRAILRLIHQPGRITGGKVLFHDQDLAQLSERALQQVRGGGISMIFQNPMTALHPVLTIERQLVETLSLAMTKPEARARALQLLKQVGIPDPEQKLKEYPHQLSGGQRQRVMIAIAIARGPQLLLADEPTTALDVTIQAEILRLLAELQRANHMALLLVSHDLGVVSQVADRVGVMYAGQIMETADTRTLLGRPAHPYTIGLIRSMPRLEEEERQPLEPIPGSPPDLATLPPGCPFAPRCAWATDICKEEVPVVELAEGHWSRCHRAEEIYRELGGGRVE
ncbi:MAG: oligopeptide/dipeptide transporter, ATP-binding protein C-terminal domain [Firmicutes bacterium]|nr:oligopeptide/dipeptide transporter, ATP-binding protein C-terminal domain [Bacillota bacterium]